MGRLAYILSASHSGSTLLAMLLGAHPEALTVGELKATSLGDPENYRCSCRERIKDCVFWSQARERMRARGFAGFDITEAGTNALELDSPYARRLLAPLYRGSFWEGLRDSALALSPRWRAHLRQTQQRNAALVEVLLEMTGARVIVDSSKVALRLKYLLRNPSLEIKVLRLVRDGRAVAMTYTDEWSFADAADPALRGGGTGEKRPPPRRSMAEAAHEWRRSNEAADCLVRTLPSDQWMRVSYEEICQNPRETLTRICLFLGLDPVRINLDFRSREQHVIGNGMRMDSASEIRLDQRWRSVLSPEDLEVFDSVAGDLNRACGYA